MSRVGTSLIFEDEDFYEEYILPLKLNKQLSPFLIKLLRAYYLDDNVRQAVDSFDLEDIMFSDTGSDNFSDILADARNTLAMMSVLSESMEDEIKAGKTDIDGMLSKISTINTEREYREETEETEEVMALPVKEAEPVTETEPTTATKPSATEDNARVEALEKSVEDLSKGMSDMQAMFMTFMQSMQAQAVPPQTIVPAPITATNESVVGESVEVTEEPAEAVEEPIVVASESVTTVEESVMIVEESVTTVEESVMIQPTAETTTSTEDIVEKQETEVAHRSHLEIIADINEKYGSQSDEPVSTETEELEDGTNSLLTFLSDFD